MISEVTFQMCVCVCKNNLSFFIIEFNKGGTNLGATKGCASFSLCLLKLVTRAPMTCPLDTSERLCSSRALRAIARFSFSALFAFFSEYETNNRENNCLLHKLNCNCFNVYPNRIQLLNYLIQTDLKALRIW